MNYFFMKTKIKQLFDDILIIDTAVCYHGTIVKKKNVTNANSAGKCRFGDTKARQAE